MPLSLVRSNSLRTRQGACEFTTQAALQLHYTAPLFSESLHRNSSFSGSARSRGRHVISQGPPTSWCGQNCSSTRWRFTSNRSATNQHGLLVTTLRASTNGHTKPAVGGISKGDCLVAVTLIAPQCYLAGFVLYYKPSIGRSSLLLASVLELLVHQANKAVSPHP